METSKKAEFVRKMGKKKLKLTKRKNMDLGGLLGMAGGAGGTGFSTNAGTNALQLNKAYDQSQNALTNQANLTNTLTPQAQTAVDSQNVLSKQFANQAAGNGPNVAQNQLNQATGANVANQASLMAGQRGAGANPALIAREAAMQGANTQQQAAGQAATLGAQQQIAAEGAGAQLAGNQIAQTAGATNANAASEQNEQNILQGANSANNTNQTQLANTTLTGQQGVLGGIASGIGGALGLAKGGEVPTHGLEFVHKMTKMGLEHHGKVMMADGGTTPTPTPAPERSHFGDPQAAADVIPANVDQSKMQGVMSGFRQTKSEGGPVLSGAQTAQDSMRQAFHFSEGGSIQDHFANYFMSEGGEVPAMVSPGEIRLTKDQVEKVVNNNEDPAKIGYKYGGKAKVSGDSVKNDVIPETLHEGDVIVDRDHMKSPEKRKLFVRKSIAKKRAKR